MGKDRQIEAALKQIAEDYRLPGGGRKKLSRLVGEHLNWFDAALARGMGWLDIIKALTAAGVTGRDGKALSVGTLSSTVWRERVRAKLRDRGDTPRAARSPRPPELRTPAKSLKGLSASPRSDRTPSTKLNQSVAKKTPSKDDLLTFMKRARAVRRHYDDG